MDRGDWQAPVHGVTKSQTRLKWLGTHYDTCVCICVYIYIFFFWYGSTVKFVYSSTNCQALFFLTNPVFIHLWCSNISKCISISCITQKHRNTHIFVCMNIYIYGHQHLYQGYTAPRHNLWNVLPIQSLNSSLFKLSQI